MRSISLLLLVFFNFQFAHAESAVAAAKISVTAIEGQARVKDLLKWGKQASKQTLSVCAEVIEIPGSLLCTFRSTLEMNRALLRIGFYTGTANGYPKGTVIDQNSSMYKKLLNEVSGHTFTLSEAEELYSKADLNTQENDFYSGVIKALAGRGSKFSIIGFPVDSLDYKTVVQHEINHAKFYLDSGYRWAATTLWNTYVIQGDQMETRQALADIYNVNDLGIVIDEFQAYLMEGDTSQNPIRSMIKKYEPVLLKLVEQAGSKPIGKLNL